MDIKEISQTIVGNNYKVCFRNPSKDNMTKIIFGKIQDFNPSGNVVVYVEGLGATQGLYIIPYIWIKWMLPNGLTEQFKDKIGCNFDKKVCLYRGVPTDEIQNTFYRNFFTIGCDFKGFDIGRAAIDTCKEYDIYFNFRLFDKILRDGQYHATIMKDYIKYLCLKQYDGKSFKDSEFERDNY